MPETKDDGVMRSFDTGATRDTGEGKLDFDGFLHPEFLEQFAKYMNMHRLQSNGELRNSDNWQKGIPTPICRKSMWRHFFEAWGLMRADTDLETGELNRMGRDNYRDMMSGLMGMVFNIQCMVVNLSKEYDTVDFDGTEPMPEIVERREKIEMERVDNELRNISYETPAWPEEEIDLDNPGEMLPPGHPDYHPALEPDCTDCLSVEKNILKFPCSDCTRTGNGTHDYYHDGECGDGRHHR